MLDFLKFVFEATKDGAAWGLFAFSLLINLVQFLVLKALWKAGQQRQDAFITVLNEVKTAITTNNTLLQIFLGKRR